MKSTTLTKAALLILIFLLTMDVGSRWLLNSPSVEAGSNVQYKVIATRDIKTGGEFFRKQASLQSPVRRAYELYNRFQGRSSWDQTAVLYAVRGRGEYFSIRKQGHNHIFSDGSNEWRSSPNKDHAYLVKKMKPEELAGIIDELMTQKPKD